MWNELPISVGGARLRIQMLPQARTGCGTTDELHDGCSLVAAEFEGLDPLEGVPQLLQGVLPVGCIAGQEAGQGCPQLLVQARVTGIRDEVAQQRSGFGRPQAPHP